MSFSVTEKEHFAEAVTFGEDAFVVTLRDGRTLSIPLTWYPRLLHAGKAERKRYRIIGNGSGIHWPDLDEDISIEGLIAGKPSNESQKSLQQWLENRQKK